VHIDGILAWDEAAGNLGEDLRGDDGLGTLALITAADAVELERRRKAHGFKAIEAGSRMEFVDAEGAAITIFGERQSSAKAWMGL
jgi:hypothetical protein